jgi:hypothetical protein
MKKDTTLTAEKLLKTLTKKGYPVSVRENTINIIGIRYGINTDDLFTDQLAIIFEKDSKQVAHVFNAVSTDCERNGYLSPGFYPDCWKIGAYMGRYLSLVSTDELGINLCHGEADPYTLKKQHWLGGTQVIKDKGEFHNALDLILKIPHEVAQTFNYALLEESDFA